MSVIIIKIDLTHMVKTKKKNALKRNGPNLFTDPVDEEMREEWKEAYILYLKAMDLRPHEAAD